MTNAIDRSTSQPARHLGLAQRLRGETRALHAAAEGSGIMRRLVRGDLAVGDYVALLDNLAEIYSVLEAELERRREHRAIQWLELEALRRCSRIEQDLQVLDGCRSRQHMIMPATRTYVGRLRHAGDTAPELLVAHAYVRYLGDLSGGRTLAAVVTRAFGCHGADVAKFYDFPLIDDIAVFKRRFREHLDGLGDGIACDGIVEEAKAAFLLHEQIFQELEQCAKVN